MKRLGIHKPTIEDIIELSGLELLHPGGIKLTRRTAELANLGKGTKVLDLSSGRGTTAIFYAKEFGSDVTGVDISEKMITTATENARRAGVSNKISFRQGDSQDLAFVDGSFDVVINECAVGIPDDSQKVVDEMVRVTRPSGAIIIHESTWRNSLSQEEKTEISERYGTTPLEFDEWLSMLEKAGVGDIITEFDEWSKPEMFWDIRKNRKVERFSDVLTLPERIVTFTKIIVSYGFKGLLKALQNEKIFQQTVLKGKLGYCLFKGIKYEKSAQI